MFSSVEFPCNKIRSDMLCTIATIELPMELDLEPIQTPYKC